MNKILTPSFNVLALSRKSFLLEHRHHQDSCDESTDMHPPCNSRGRIDADSLKSAHKLQEKPEADKQKRGDVDNIEEEKDRQIVDEEESVRWIFVS